MDLHIPTYPSTTLNFVKPSNSAWSRQTRESSPLNSNPPPTSQAGAIKPDPLLPYVQTNEMHVWEDPISKLYTDDCGRFTICSRSVNQYIMIAYHCDYNTVLGAPFNTQSNKHRIEAYNYILERSAKRGHKVNLQLINNKQALHTKSSLKTLGTQNINSSCMMSIAATQQRGPSELPKRISWPFYLVSVHPTQSTCGKNCWTKRNSHSTSCVKPPSTQAYPHGNISTGRSTFTSLHSDQWSAWSLFITRPPRWSHDFHVVALL